MSGIAVHRFERQPIFRLAEPRSFDAQVEEEVTEIWRGVASDQRLTDNEIFCVSRWDESLEVERVPYRYYFAQRLRPELFPNPLVALAVSGILTCEGRFVVGRRADWVSQDPRALELAPSGSVDADVVSDGEIDLLAQFHRELAEELGIDEEDVHEHRILGVVDNREEHVVDIVIAATVKCALEELFQAHARLPRPEYSSVHAFTFDELQLVINDGTDPVSAVSSAIFVEFCTTLDRLPPSTEKED